jgi:hypothetical protein
MLLTNYLMTGARPRGGGAAGLQFPPPPKPPKTEIKKIDFVDIMISEVLCDFHFTHNQPIKLADE